MVDLSPVCASYGAGEQLALACRSAEGLPGVEIEVRKERCRLSCS